ncbi:unnamed protein product [Symbiodinium sp. KB8]|nr:unnamed protein product [Symbiodinium sp. KB8]
MPPCLARSPRLAPSPPAPAMASLLARRASSALPRAARVMSSDAVTVAKESSSAVSSVAAAPKAAPTVVKRGPGLFAKTGAFLIGAAAGSGVAFYAVHKDVWDSTVQIEQSIYNLKTDVVAENRRLRQSIAKLEQEVQALKAGR